MGPPMVGRRGGANVSVKSYDKLFIGGEWVVPEGTGTIEVISPYTEEVIATVPDGTVGDVNRAVATAREAFDRGPWPRMSIQERASILAKVGARLGEELPAIAELITEEMGTPILFSQLAQVGAPMMIFNYFAGLGDTYSFDSVRAGVLSPEVLVTKEPVGVVGAIAPWNVPLFLAAAKLAPALLAGCTVVFKPAPETPLDVIRLAEILDESGLPKGVLSIVPAGREVSEHLVSHPDVDKISFTGSPAAGRKIAALCGEQLKRCTLELGGKSAAILLDDVDLDATLPMLMPNALMNNGQACIAQTRILAPRARYDEVVDAMCSHVQSDWTVGDPMDMATAVGPLVAARQRDRVESYIAKGKDEGAIAKIGGNKSSQPHGWFVEPTIFSNVDNKMAIAQEEIFGPVLVVIPYDGDDDAVAIANDSDYGLCGSVFTADNDRGLGVARQVRTGTYMLNSATPIDFASPFGGYKASGIGREFGPEGLDSFLEVKSINLPAGYTPSV